MGSEKECNSNIIEREDHLEISKRKSEKRVINGDIAEKVIAPENEQSVNRSR
jgi:hypothetical protein